MVCHRRAGKTVACINDLIDAALRCEKQAPRFSYIAPLRTQAKDVAWDYLKHYAMAVPGTTANEQELRVDFPNGARIRLYGADNPDSLRGPYVDGVVFDEYAQIHPSVWAEVIRPALADRHGWATFIGTPQGRNEFCKQWEKAQADPDWFSLMLKASQTGLVPQAELDDARKGMSADQYDQEFECSFDAAIVGAYYAKLIAQAEADKRIGRVPWEAALPVHTAWDLGHRNATVIWFFQILGREVRIIDYYEMTGASLTQNAGAVLDRKARGWAFGKHILPHDANVVELTREDGKSRLKILESLGIVGEVLPSDNVPDGIEAVRTLLPRCYFNAETTAPGIAHLREYRSGYDERLKVLKPNPIHDIHSDAADAFRYVAMGMPGEAAKPKPLKYPKGPFV